MSEHSVNIIEISEVRPHDNAERLEVVPIDGWQAVVRKGEFKPGDRAVYIEPDYCVPTARAEFGFLARDGREHHRLRAIRLRGVLSFGLLIRVPDDVAGEPVGANVMAALGIVRYVPPMKESGGDDLPEDQMPRVYTPVFDVENIQRFADALREGEDVIVTEKIHGANARYLFSDGVFYMGSRTRWLRPDANHIWREAALARPEIEGWCAAHPDTILFGEVFGRVQSLRYGLDRSVDFAAFAALHKDQWQDLDELISSLTAAEAPVVPVLYRGPFRGAETLALAEQDSRAGQAPTGHMMEGIVITPIPERRDERLGRVAFKHISARYWTGDAE